MMCSVKFILVFLLAVLPTVESQKQRCYSCMSEIYHQHWRHIKFLYHAPSSFSSDCDQSPEPGQIATVPCDAPCFTLREDLQIAGHVFWGFVRGCSSSSLVDGFNSSAVSLYRWSEFGSCRWYRRLRILNGAEGLKDDSIHICVCNNHRCNGKSKGAALEREVVPEENTWERQISPVTAIAESKLGLQEETTTVAYNNVSKPYSSPILSSFLFFAVLYLHCIKQ